MTTVIGGMSYTSGFATASFITFTGSNPCTQRVVGTFSARQGALAGNATFH